MKSVEELKVILSSEPRALDDRCGLFKQCTPEQYKELALHAMTAARGGIPPEQFNHCRTDISGWAMHHITKAVFEEQDIFDPYADQGFIEAAAAICPWYVKRYTEEA